MAQTPGLAYVVRAAEEGDLPNLVALLAALFSIEEDFDFDAKKQLSGLQQLLACMSASIQVAVGSPPSEGGSGRILGMATCQAVISTAEGGPAGVVEDVVVAQEAQGQGVGRALLDAVEAWAKQHGIRRLQLLYDTKNEPALRFYQHMGWKTTQLACLRKYL